VSKSPWCIGAFGYVLKNPRPVKPIPCSGALSFWNLPLEIEGKIKSAI